MSFRNDAKIVVAIITAFVLSIIASSVLGASIADQGGGSLY